MPRRLQPACSTTIPQCAFASEQAWIVYLNHYKALLDEALPSGTDLEESQAAWERYRSSQCGIEGNIHLLSDCAWMHSTIITICMANKASARAIELRGLLIDMAPHSGS